MLANRPEFNANEMAVAAVDAMTVSEMADILPNPDSLRETESGRLSANNSGRLSATDIALGLT